FCSEPGILDTNGSAKFDEFLAIAEAAGIYVHPTGPDHWEGTPEWARVDRIADERTLRRLEMFWQEFAARYRHRAVIFAYDLRNEPEVLWDPQSSPRCRRKLERPPRTFPPSLPTGERAGGARNPSRRVRVERREIDDLFTNPGMGWQTFHRLDDE